MIHALRTRTARLALATTVGLFASTLGFFAWQTYYPVQAADGWEVQVLHDSVANAASLLPQADGSLLVSRELRDGQGSILRITVSGEREVVVDGLSKPDGMVGVDGGWVFSQEVGEAPVRLSRDGQLSTLFQGNNVQGMFNEGQYLYAIEDRKGDGRLLRYDWHSGQLEVLRSGLTETEGLTRCTDGRLLYTEKASGRIRAFDDSGKDPVVADGLRNPTFLFCDSRGLWISEDSTHRARLLRIDSDGRRHTVLTYLKAPQAIVPDGQGGYLLAEGGRDRILRLTPPVVARTAQAQGVATVPEA
ncbi:MAG: SMP-30/gluconolactonase/LRE family protein [Paucimonas sp.]|jgi:hypothetical protein|nr:SMP-30/gluconolactonase/LRE family protein [Paucimonas sp.]